MSKTLILLYAVISYFIGVAGLAVIIGALAGLIPFGFFHWGNLGQVGAIFWNFALVAIWGFIHTSMARPSFKAAMTKFIPVAAERATYILVSGLTSVALIGLWQSVEGQVWNVQATGLVYVLWGLFAFGWVFLLAATFAINHFDLFGLQQAFLNFKSQPNPPQKFVKRAMYRYIRHPIQTGVLIGVWATPFMSITHIILSIGFTVYIFIGLWFEERDLVREHGEAYVSYRKTAGKVLPKFGAR